MICKDDCQENQELYKFNGMSEKQMKLDLCVILTHNQAFVNQGLIV